MLHNWNLCKGHLLDFFQGLKHLPLPGEIGGYRYPIFLAPLTYRQPTVPAGLHTSAPLHQPVLLIGSLYTRRLLHPRTSLSQSLEYSLVLPCTISDSYSLAEDLFPDKSRLELTLTADLCTRSPVVELFVILVPVHLYLSSKRYAEPKLARLILLFTNT